VIYIDTSVALAALFVEERAPPQRLWSQLLISSRLFEYEIMNRVNARKLGAQHIDAARKLIDCVDLLELQPNILIRALQPFPQPVRTLDALHLASMEFLRAQKQSLELATYDQRLADAAQALGFPLAPIT
jgi:predicted nucleic acid-binding protein